MKNELIFDEIKKELKKLQEKSSSKVILLIVLSMVAVGLTAVLVIMKIKDKYKFDESEFDDDEYVYYDDDNDDDEQYYDDYRALDYDHE